MQLSCLISSYGLHVYYAGSAVHNRQAKARVNGLDPQEVARINFHNMTLPAFACPPPDPNSKDKFPAQLQPTWDASLSLREPFAAFFEEMSHKFRRIVIVRDPMMAAIVQDAASIFSSVENETETQHRCFQWLDKQEQNSVILVSFGTTTSLSDEQIQELASGLEQSKVKFLWVVRDADKADIFDGQVRRSELPEGFEARTEEGCEIRKRAEELATEEGCEIRKRAEELATEEGCEIRKRAEELAAIVRDATQPGGTSRLELDSFIAHITR